MPYRVGDFVLVDSTKNGKYQGRVIMVLWKGNHTDKVVVKDDKGLIHCEMRYEISVGFTKIS